MVFSGGFKEEATRGDPHADQLLEEYMRVINDKDDQLHRLLRQLEEHQAHARHADDTHKTRIKELSQQLKQKEAKLKEARRQSSTDEELNSKLVQHAEALKSQLASSEGNVAELSTTLQKTADAKQSLENDLAAARSSLAAMQAQKEDADERWQATQRELDKEQTDTKTLQERLQSTLKSLDESRAEVAELHLRMQAMIPREEHAQTLKVLEGAAATTRTQLQRDIAALKENAEQKQAELAQTQTSFRSLQEEASALQDSLQATTKTLEVTRQQLRSAEQAAQQTEKELRDEVARRRVAQQELTERLHEVQRALVRAQEATERTTADLHAAQLQCERYKAAASKAQDGTQAQLRAASDQLRQAQEDADRTRRQLEAKERAATDVTDGLQRLRDDTTRAAAEAREKIATLTADVTAKRSECDRLQCELLRAQSTRQDDQRRSLDDERAVRQKLEELQGGVDRLQRQLRDREEEARRLELVHGKEVQKLQHDHAAAIEDLKRRHETETRDLHAWLERYRVELGEQTGGSKGLEKELHHTGALHREMQGELSRLQSIIDMKEAAVQNLKREAGRLQGDAAQLTQRLAGHEKDEATVRRRLEESERAHLDAQASAQRAQEKAQELVKTVAAGAASLTAAEEQLRNKDVLIAQLHHEREEWMQARQAAQKDAMQHKAQREQAGLTLESTEAQLRACTAELRDAVQEQKRLQRLVDDGATEVRRMSELVAQREAECSRVAQHAEEVERLAKHTVNELRDTVRERDETIHRLRAEQAAVLPRLSEEQSKALVLQEKLQHHQETSRADADAAQHRLRHSEEQLRTCQDDAAALQEEKARLEQQLAASQAQASDAARTLESKEAKYQQRKDEIQKALRQVAEVQAATAVTLQETEAQRTAAAALRDKYRKERAKMETLIQRMEGRVRESARHEKEGRQRESALIEKLDEAEAALRRVQNSADSRVNETRLHYDELIRQQDESFREAASNALALEKQRTVLQAQLVEAQRRAASVEGSQCELQRHVAACEVLAREAYVEAALEIKRSCVQLLVQAKGTLLDHAAKTVKTGLAAVQHTSESLRSKGTDLEAQLLRVRAAHRAELVALAEAHARQREAAVAEHHEEVARLQRTTQEAERRAAEQTAALQRSEGGREARTRALEDALQRMTELLDLEKAQSAAYRDRAASEERQRQEDMRSLREAHHTLQRRHDVLQRRLEDRVVEQTHNEDELREQKAEVAALQRVLAEQTRESQQEVARSKEAMKAASAAVAEAEKRCEDLRGQLDFMRGQLETARASHQRLLEEQQTAQRTRDTRLEAAQAELATVAAERRRLQADLSAQENRVRELIKEVQALRRQEADLTGQLHTRKTDLSALRERCANLESLKNISELSLAETQARERDLAVKLEELRNAQQLMQLCFDKQQEQLEVGRRLRQQDAQMCSRFSP